MKKNLKAMSVVCSTALFACSMSGCLGEYESTDSGSGKSRETAEVEVSDTSFSELPETVVRDKQVTLSGDGSDQVTILIYCNGSNLESEDGEATSDLEEIVEAGYSDQVNILVQTMGTSSWSDTFGIASDHSQIYQVTKNGLELVNDNLEQLDCTAPETLSDFIAWGAQNYPADRYILQFWDHGGGPVYGFGYDEFQDESAALTIDEMQSALQTAGVYFDFIGMDCCLMSSLELCCALYDYCDYMILSEDFESGLGWSYTKWIKALYDNPSIATTELGKVIIDSMVSANEQDSYNGDESILSLIDEGTMKLLYSAWTEFAYANEDTLLENNYSQKVMSKGRALPLRNDWFSDWLDESSSQETYTMSDYYISDIMSLASTIDSKESEALSSALSNTILYSNSTEGESSLTGLSVTLPYSDSDFYDSLSTIFTNCGIDSTYIKWLGNFVSAEGTTSFYNYDSFNWNGWSDYEDEYDWSEYEDYSDWNTPSYDDYDYSWDDWDYDESYNNWLDDSDFVEDYYEDEYYDDWDNWDDTYDDYYYDDYDYYDDDYADGYDYYYDEW